MLINLGQRDKPPRSVLKYAWALYNADWDVFENDTDTEYLTSDNPASFEDQGDTWGPPGIPFVRYLPVTPRLCLRCDLTRNPSFMHTPQDFTQEPKGSIQGGFIDRPRLIPLSQVALNLVWLPRRRPTRRGVFWAKSVARRASSL